MTDIHTIDIALQAELETLSESESIQYDGVTYRVTGKQFGTSCNGCDLINNDCGILLNALCKSRQIILVETDPRDTKEEKW